MASRGMKDTALQLEKRTVAAKKVKMQFLDDTFTHFNVLDENKKIKYTGKINIQLTQDECSCDSFFYGMKFEKISEDSEKIESRYVAENGSVFQCKHIIAAKNLRTEEYPDE